MWRKYDWLGKIALALNIAEKNILEGNSVAIFSLEMGLDIIIIAKQRNGRLGIVKLK